MFFKCTNLEAVYYYGTIETWMNLDHKNWSSNPMYYADEFYLISDNGEVNKLKEIVIPEGITEIKDYQFKGFDSLTSITLPCFNCSIIIYSF